jgi:hypothetical protein
MSKSILTEEQMRDQVIQHIENDFDSQLDAANHYGWTDSYISSVVNGKSAPPVKICEALGYKRKKPTQYHKVTTERA